MRTCLGLTSALLLVGCTGEDPAPRGSSMTVHPTDGDFTVQFDTVVIQGDASGRGWTMQGNGTTNNVYGSLEISFAFEVGYVLEAVDYRTYMSITPYAANVTVNERGVVWTAGPAAGQGGDCTIKIHNVPMPGEPMSVDVSGIVDMVGAAMRMSAHLEGLRAAL